MATTTPNDSSSTASSSSPPDLNPQLLTLIAKFGKERITLSDLNAATTTIGDVKTLLQQQTHVLPHRQKLIGLTAKSGGTKAVVDSLLISELKQKKGSATTSPTEIQFICMGTPEDQIFIDPSDQPDLPDVVDDMDWDCSAGSEEWLNNKANIDNLQQFAAKTECVIIHPPRDAKPLLVLDLDHTLLDFSSKSILRQSSSDATSSNQTLLLHRMKRPHMDAFLAQCYQHYDLVVWSQTSWRWLETKLVELGMLTHPQYKFCFVLDKTSMFTVVSQTSSSSSKRRPSHAATTRTHHVKPLQIIWSRFGDRWGAHNTVHLDDLGRNFALNLGSGLKIKAYHRNKPDATHDGDLHLLGPYLQQVAQSGRSFEQIDFAQWRVVATGDKQLEETCEDDKKKSNG